jgi:hypothetical protein
MTCTSCREFFTQQEIFEKEGHQRVNLEDKKLHTSTIIFTKLNSHQTESLPISMQAFLFTFA